MTYKKKEPMSMPLERKRPNFRARGPAPGRNPLNPPISCPHRSMKTASRQSPGRQAAAFSLLAAGASSIAVELVLVRELLSVFGGNELVIGAALGVWLLAGGAGAILSARRAARTRRPEAALFWGHIAGALLPAAALLAARALPFTWVRGGAPGFGHFLWGAAPLLFFPAALFGALPPLACRLDPRPGAAGRAYAWCAAGDAAGGLAFGLILIHAVSHFGACVAMGLLHAGAALFLARGRLSRAHRLPVVLAAAILLTSIAADRPSFGWRFAGEKLLWGKDTAYGRLAVTERGGRAVIWTDGAPLASTDEPGAEALVHPALCQVPARPRVLLLGCGAFPVLDEIGKHRPLAVDDVEPDRALLDLGSSFSGKRPAGAVREHAGDGRAFIRRRAGGPYDAVILDLPPPESLRENRFFTLEFFREARRVLSQKGVLAFRLPGAENYMEDETLALDRAVFAALSRVFPRVLVLPGPENIFLASAAPLTSGIAPILAARKIKTRRLAAYDIFSLTDPFRIDELAGLLKSPTVRPNRDLSPFAFRHALSLWLEKSKSTAAWPAALFGLSLLFALASFRRDGALFTVMSTGCAGMGLTLCLILIFQAVYGCAYSMLCVFTTLFLAGSAAGGFYASARPLLSIRAVRFCEAALAASAALSIPAAVMGVQAESAWGPLMVSYGVLPALLLAAGFASGCQIAIISRSLPVPPPASLGRAYGADLAGSAVGTLALGLFLLPRAGILPVLLALALVKGVNLLANPALRRG